MIFNTYRTMLDIKPIQDAVYQVDPSLRTEKSRPAKIKRFYDVLTDESHWQAGTAPSDDYLTQVRARCEQLWLVRNRPYYNVYPVIFDLVDKLPEDSPLVIPKLPVLLSNAEFEKYVSYDQRSLRETRGVALNFEKQALAANEENMEYSIESMLVIFRSREEDDSSTVRMDIAVQWCDERGDSVNGMLEFDLHPDRGDATIASTFEDFGDIEHRPKHLLVLKRILKVVAALGLLTEGKLGLLERDVCKADLGKPLTEAVLARMHKRKGDGFNLGRSLQETPHFRRPHWGIRWMKPEEGEVPMKRGLVPRLRPIKAALVKKTAITKMPTGYHDEE